MKKSFLGGIILLVGLISTSLVFQDYSFLVNIGGTVGVVSIILAGLTTGAFQQRSIPAENYPLEDKTLRDTKSRWSKNVFLFGLPSFIGAIITFILLL
jgi:hypothetical protein